MRVYNWSTLKQGCAVLQALPHPGASAAVQQQSMHSMPPMPPSSLLPSDLLNLPGLPGRSGARSDVNLDLAFRVMR